MSALDELLKEYQKWNSLPSSQVDISKFNKIKELIGEAAARAEVSTKYGASTLKYVSVPERYAGTPILDLLFELDTGELVLVEAKFGTSLLGRTNDRRVFLVDGDKLRQLPLQRQVEQLEVIWTKDRIAEIGKLDPELAKKLSQAIDSQKLHILELRTRVEIAKGKPLQLSSQSNDHTERFRKAAKTGRRSTEDPLRELERGAARREALSDMHLKAATVKAKENEKVVAEAKKKAKNAANKVERAKKELEKAKANPLTRKATIPKREKALADAKKTEREEQAELEKAQEVLDRSEKKRKFASEQKARDAAAREAEAAWQRELAWAKLRGDRPATAKTTDTAAKKQAEAVKDTATAERRVGSSIDGDRAVANRAVESSTAGNRGIANRLEGPAADTLERAVVRAAPKVAELGRVRPVVRFALTGLKYAAKVGRVVFVVLDLANPIFDLWLAVDLFNSFLDWLQREKIEEREEWERIADFLFGTPKRIKSVYGIEYLTSVRDMENRLIELKLADDNYTSGNFPHWLDKWNNDRKWSGFVYVQTNIDLERQEQQHTEEPYGTKYYPAGAFDIVLTDNPLENWKDIRKFVGLVGPQEDRNRSTLGREAPRSDPDYTIDVEISQIAVRYTYPGPILTPFEFIIIKSRQLLAEIVAFISQYDSGVIEGTEIEYDYGVTKKGNLFEKPTFNRPIVSQRVWFCTDAILASNAFLSDHVLQRSDLIHVVPGRVETEYKYAKFNKGYYRRLEMLRRINSPQSGGVTLFRQVGLQLNNLVTDVNPRYVINPIAPDPETVRRLGLVGEGLKYMTTGYLAEFAFDIESDLKRALADCNKESTSLEYNYEGKAKGR